VQQKASAPEKIGDVSRALSPWERLSTNSLALRIFILAILAVAWQVYASIVHNALLFPTLTDVLDALWRETRNGVLPDRALTSIRLLLTGYVLGVVCAAILSTVAVTTRLGSALLSTLTAMFNPLPAIALLPLALLWFGLGMPSIVFVLIHAVLWPLALNTHSGFLAVSETLRMTGQNCGLRGIRYVIKLLIPAAFPSILTGFKIAWAFAWRTLIAAELVFGISARSGGIGWFIFERRNQLETADVFAGLFVVIIIGLLVESLIFRALENVTVRRWGMQR
jgi:NitT/TauT family transport system permease protein